MPQGNVRLVIAGTAELTDVVVSELLPSKETGRRIGERWVSNDGSIAILPTISRPDFLRLMRHATAVVYPSRYEGFGLPTIEAMAVGTPLIAARATSIPEIVGDAGILVDPDDVVGFANAMSDLLERPDLSRRLIASGRERIRRFALERLGRGFLALLASILRGLRPAVPSPVVLRQASNATLPPAAVVLTVRVCSAQNRGR